MISMEERVGIIGAGVSGLTCAVLFAERGYHTHILAEETGSAHYFRGRRRDLVPIRRRTVRCGDRLVVGNFRGPAGFESHARARSFHDRASPVYAHR